jgi:hypothetical protein
MHVAKQWVMSPKGVLRFKHKTTCQSPNNRVVVRRSLLKGAHSGDRLGDSPAIRVLHSWAVHSHRHGGLPPLGGPNFASHACARGRRRPVFSHWKHSLAGTGNSGEAQRHWAELGPVLPLLHPVLSRGGDGSRAAVAWAGLVSGVRSRGRRGRIDFGYTAAKERLALTVLPPASIPVASRTARSRMASQSTHSNLLCGITSVFLKYVCIFLRHAGEKDMYVPHWPSHLLPTMVWT